MEFPATLVQILEQAEVQDQVSVTAPEEVETLLGTRLSPGQDLTGRPVDVRVVFSHGRPRLKGCRGV